MCSNYSQSQSGSNGGGLTATVPIHGVPVTVGGNYNKVKSDAISSGQCRTSSNSMDENLFSAVMATVVAPEIVQAWSACVLHASGLFLNGDLNGSDLVLEFHLRPLGDITKTRIDGNLQFSGVRCPNPIIVDGYILGAATRLVKCKRIGREAVTVIVNSKPAGGAKFFIPQGPPNAIEIRTEMSQKLVGVYNVSIGKNRGCEGSEPFTNITDPQHQARIWFQPIAWRQKNECGQTPPLRS